MSNIKPILDKAVAGERLTPEDGVALLRSHDLIAIGEAANEVTKRLHPEPYRTYNIDRNINYTNACAAICDFCAFYRPVGHDEVYVLSKEALHKKVQETVDLGGDQILIQGGLHPTLPLEWYEEMLSGLREEFPQVNVHGFSPPELYHFHKISKLPLKTVLERLKEAGLGSVPGGGGEILVDRVRKAITRGKVLTDDWLNVMRVWHEIGGRSTATSALPSESRGTAVPPHASARPTAFSQVRLATKMSDVPAAARDFTVPSAISPAPSTSTVRPSRPPRVWVASATAA